MGSHETAVIYSARNAGRLGYLVKAFPRELFAGSDVKQFEDVLTRYKGSLYPTSAAIDLPAAKRVADTLKIAGLVAANADVSGLHDTSIAGG